MLGLWLLLGAAGPAPIVGRATVIDGDTISVAKVQIRLWGVDAPEGRQACRDAAGRSYRCGEAAAARLRTLTAAGPVICIVRDHDTNGRVVSQCRAS
ncbi:MAG: hypothetical protein U1C74_26490 [Phenylobacterium sp.]|nr:hypothetical protein [Phenylobacterium sp.]